MNIPWFIKLSAGLAVCLLAGVALGDLGPHHVVPPEYARVSMQHAKVLVKLTSTNSTTIQAEVDGMFDMRFEGKMYEYDSRKLWFAVDFPISFLDDKQPQPTNFTASIDGKPVTNLYETTWYVFLADGNTSRQVVGYAWRCEAGKVKAPVVRRFKVHYTLDLKKADGQAAFTYFLRTGALWDGPIHKEIVKVTIQKGLKVKITSPTSTKPMTLTDDTIAWEIVDAKPTEDIQLKISGKAK